MTETDPFSMPITDEGIELLFEIMLSRQTGNEQFKKDVVKSGVTIRQFIARLRHSDELKEKVHEQFQLKRDKQGIPPLIAPYRAPAGLRVSELGMGRVLIVGSCWSTHWKKWLRDICDVDLYLVGPSLPSKPEHPLEKYAFQIVQVPLRSMIPDSSFSRLSHADVEGHEKLFAHAQRALRNELASAMRWNAEHGILTFVTSLIVPQQNFVGRLLPRYDIRNPVYFVEKLNEDLARLIAEYNNVYFFDINEVLASFGKKYAQEDAQSAFNHGTFLDDFMVPADMARLERTERATRLYNARITEAYENCWNELTAMYRTIRRTDAVKMVAIDLDDTLWRGVIADTEPGDMPTSEGWPLGFWEALNVLKRRGILLAIVSKNEETRVREAWDSIVKKNLKLDDFAICKINWDQKSKNMEDILLSVNLLPENVVYIDDNPSQRADIKAAFPQMRVIGGAPNLWRHLLLWAPETQIAEITGESANRTQMVQAQVRREDQRRTTSNEDFLTSLDIKISFSFMNSTKNPRFSRAFELINKTNQFNTTGKRWLLEDCTAGFANGLEFCTFEVTDRYTDYGLVGVLIIAPGEIQQFVMSCRVMSLEVEVAAIAYISGIFRKRGSHQVTAAMVVTDRNLPCRDVFSQCGFTEIGGKWQMDLAEELQIPAHITLASTI